MIAALSLAAVSTSVNAASYYISGSSAFRAGANYGFTNTVPGIGLGYVLMAGDTNNGASLTLGRYTNSAGDSIFVKWTGSEGGYQNVSSTNASEYVEGFLPTDASGFSYNKNSAGTSTNRVDIAFADTDQSSGFFKGFGAKANANSSFYPTVTTTTIGVIPFMFAATTNGSPGLTNITTAQAKQLFLNGSVPMTLWTGNLADTNKAIYAVGRNTDSGTRMSFLAEVGYKPAQRLKQFRVTANDTGALYPLETIRNCRSLYVGNSGFNGSSDLTAALKWTVANASSIGITPQTGAAYSVGYTGAGGAGTGYAPMAYNGVSYTVSGVTNGSYGFWSYQRLALSTAASASAGTFYTNLVTSITNASTSTLPSGIISLLDMNVSKSADGAAVANLKY